MLYTISLCVYQSMPTPSIELSGQSSTFQVAQRAEIKSGATDLVAFLKCANFGFLAHLARCPISISCGSNKSQLPIRQYLRAPCSQENAKMARTR